MAERMREVRLRVTGKELPHGNELPAREGRPFGGDSPRASGGARPACSLRTVSAHGARQLLMFGVKHGLDPEVLCQQAGITPAHLAQGDAHVPHAWAAAILRVLRERLPDVPLGLELGTFSSLDQLAYLGHAMKYCGSALECLRIVVQCAPLLDTLMRELPPVLELGAATVSWRMPSLRDDPQECAEAHFALIVNGLRSLQGASASPVEVRFSGSCSAQRALLESFFAAPVSFGCDCDTLVFPRAFLEAPIVHADSTIRGNFVRAFLRRMANSEDPLTNLVRRVIDAELEHGVLSQSRVARRLGMSARSLQRRLRERKVRYHELIEQTRKNLAIRLLSDPLRNVNEVALALGYDVRSFHRVFRRWMGMSPSAYRRATARTSNAER